MILGGYLPHDPERKVHTNYAQRAAREVGSVSVELTVDTSNFERQISLFARRTIALDVTAELWRLTPDQAWARFYVRGAMDPEYAPADRRDHYLRALLLLADTPKSRAARDGFLAGWAAHRDTEPVEPFAWHRFIGDTAISVGVSTQPGDAGVAA